MLAAIRDYPGGEIYVCGASIRKHFRRFRQTLYGAPFILIHSYMFVCNEDDSEVYVPSLARCFTCQKVVQVASQAPLLADVPQVKLTKSLYSNALIPSLTRYRQYRVEFFPGVNPVFTATIMYLYRMTLNPPMLTRFLQIPGWRAVRGAVGADAVGFRDGRLRVPTELPVFPLWRDPLLVVYPI